MTFKQFWHKISYLGIQTSMSEIEQRSIILTNQIAALGIPSMLFIVLMLAVVAGGFVPIDILHFVNMAIAIAVICLNYKKYVFTSRMIISALPAINVTIVSIYTKYLGLSTSLSFALMPRTGLVIFALLPVLLFGYANLRYMLVGMSVPLTCLFLFDFLHQLFGINLSATVYLPFEDYPILKISPFFVLLGVFPSILVIQRLNMQYEQEVYQQKEEILAQRDDLDEKSTELQKLLHEISLKNENITASINYAKRIQTAMMPTEDEIKKVFPQSFVFFKPRDIVSGDFYYFSDLGHTVIMAAVDCTGHGVPGAFMSLIGNEILNETILGKDFLDTDLILNELHLGVQKALKQKETQNKDGMDICLVSLTREESNPESKFASLSYSGAMNPLYIVKNKVKLNKDLEENSVNNSKEFIEIKADKYAIGGVLSKNRIATFTKHTIDLTEKDTNYTIFIASDGYQDQFGGEKGSKFMVKHFKTLLESISQETPEQQKQILDYELNKWQHSYNKHYEQVDDILVIGIKI